VGVQPEPDRLFNVLEGDHGVKVRDLRVIYKEVGAAPANDGSCTMQNSDLTETDTLRCTSRHHEPYDT
jgi:hypothetical protein